jgi:hypothetical protein
MWVGTFHLLVGNTFQSRICISFLVLQTNLLLGVEFVGGLNQKIIHAAKSSGNIYNDNGFSTFKPKLKLFTVVGGVYLRSVQ